jgi:uncharacterized protein (DUF305 family)
MEARSTRWRLILMTVLAILLTGCGTAQQTNAPLPTTANPAPTAAAAPTAMSSMPAMGHGSTPMADSEAPYDAQFIDSMIEHHQGAIDMANQALKEATKPELKTLAQTIVTAQQGEIEHMQEWRKTWYGDLAPTAGMGMDMGNMQLSADTSKPFDQRFIEAMIAHHQGAITMAKDAQQKAEHTEIKTLAQSIITAQESEITQMQQWLKEWFNV